MPLTKLVNSVNEVVKTVKKIKTLPQDAVKANQLMQKRRNANNEAYAREFKRK